ncbi:MAG: cytochrome c [Syntrophobacter sp.]
MVRILIFLAAISALAFGVLWSGIYNISALDPHWETTLQLLALARDRSIAFHGSEGKTPVLADPTLPTKGASTYRESCSICHGAPGGGAEAFSQGLYPAPADLLSGHIQKKWKDNQLYWIVENGIKMTGMPAFGFTLEPGEMSGIVAFLKRLPGMKPEEYSTLSGGPNRKARDGG